MRWRPAGAGLVLALCMLGACADARVDAIRVRAKPSAAVERPRVVAAAPIEVHGPPAEARLDPETAATPAAAEVVRTLATLRDSIVETRYQGRRDIRPEDGYYAWDCSAMAAWVLRQSAPRARRSLRSGRPLARRFFHTIDRIPAGKTRRGWQRLGHVADARPGDLFTWLRSPASKSKITGHVGFFVEQPRPLPDEPFIYVARVADSTGLPHGDDTRRRDGDGGFGFGTLLFVTDDTGETIAYGWHGERSLEWGFMPARVIYGRVAR